MYTNNDKENSRPVTPTEEDCCHSACEPCIFDIHKKLLEEYERRKKKNIKSEKKHNVLCTYAYKNFLVIDKVQTSESYMLLSLKYEETDPRSNTRILIDPGQHVMLHLYDTTKPFTPISFTENTIKFLIRLYPDGKFSTYLRNIEIGDTIRVRGPYGNFKYEDNSSQTIIMFSMGSGIAAMYPIAKSIVDNELEETRIHMIGGFQNVLQIPLRKELQALTDYWNFKCTLHISQLQDDHSLHGITIKSGRLYKESILEVLQDKVPDSTLILICGTREFNSSVEHCVKSVNYSHTYIFQ